MTELISTYSFEEIVAFLALIFAALMGVYKVVEFCAARFNEWYERKTADGKISTAIERNNQDIQEIKDIMQILVESDKCRIRGEILREHQRYMDMGYIPYNSLEYIKKQYDCYQQEGGNSFVKSLMEDLEGLPQK